MDLTEIIHKYKFDPSPEGYVIRELCNQISQKNDEIKDSKKKLETALEFASSNLNALENLIGA